MDQLRAAAGLRWAGAAPAPHPHKGYLGRSTRHEHEISRKEHQQSLSHTGSITSQEPHHGTGKVHARGMPSPLCHVGLMPPALPWSTTTTTPSLLLAQAHRMLPGHHNMVGKHHGHGSSLGCWQQAGGCPAGEKVLQVTISIPPPLQSLSPSFCPQQCLPISLPPQLRRGTGGNVIHTLQCWNSSPCHCHGCAHL